MEEGNIVRIDIPQADGKVKVRPVLLLKQLPPFGDWLTCGISSSLGLQVEDFDVVIHESDIGFPETGLKRTSLIRLGFLGVVPKERMIGAIGSVSKQTHTTLINRLSDHLRK